MGCAKSVLVTGATSQIGRFLLARLADGGFSITALSRNPPQSGGKITWIQADVQTIPADLSLPRVDILFHLTGLPLLPALMEHPISANLTRIIAFSSTSRFSKQASPDSWERSVASGLAAGEETLAQMCAARNIAWTLFRPTLIYGSGQDRNISFIAWFIRRFGFFPMQGKGSGLRQPVHADDLARACLQCLAHPASCNRAYNLSGGKTLSYRQMVEAIFRGLGKKPRILPVPPWLFKQSISRLGWLLPFKHVTIAMLERMNKDLCFDHTDARRDFAYHPRGFNHEDLGF
ncbi:MAG: NAD-dependent epimerase/dehydratase family protein [Gammaproteobacteria bacterium]|nr:NAD-dependent epimerase/dehydratase family protein [Gammaproteobacteria bacterium]